MNYYPSTYKVTREKALTLYLFKERGKNMLQYSCLPGKIEKRRVV